MKHAIFINYRSYDEPFAALLIERLLAERFGRGQVFRDSRAIPLGTYFPDQISQALQHCRALIAIIGERWLCRGPDGRRRIDHPEDYVRHEIATALRREILVVPVLVGETSLPGPEQLPADLGRLASQQYLHLRVRSADNDASRLVSELAGTLGGAVAGANRATTTGHPGVAVACSSFHGPVDARHAVIGNVYSAG